ncbi:MAG: TylF/MycF/NovP-related O-methyltransferase [Solirubrobacteraceae bacterium]
MPGNDGGPSPLLRLTQHPALSRGARSIVRRLAARANYHVIRGMADPGLRPDVDRFLEAMPWSITSDYVRQGTAQLLCREIAEHEVAGAIGELGVFRGDFASLLSGYLLDRPVHLFDTFEGFDERDVAVDARENLVDDFIDFSATDPRSVRARFADPGRVSLHPGWFPQSAAGAEDVTFALVSIDADLYAPVLEGLNWFYERLSPGGYILVHDFNNGAFGGAKKATREFQARTGAPLVPIPDWGGTAIVARSGADP